MVPTKLSALHRAEQGESLRSVAQRFGLGTWLAIARAPGNEHVGELAPSSPLPEGVKLRIPPKARDLLKERIYSLEKARQSFRGYFDHQDRIFERDVGLPGLEAATGAPAIQSMLGNLQAHLATAVADARAVCRPIAVINSGLAQTHLHAEGELYATADQGSVALDWLLEAALVHSWSQMWSVGLWSQRWHGCDPVTARERTVVYKNVVRTRVLQRIDLRARQTFRAIEVLDEECLAIE